MVGAPHPYVCHEVSLKAMRVMSLKPIKHIFYFILLFYFKFLNKILSKHKLCSISFNIETYSGTVA